MKKIGLLVLALLIAFGALGVGYAMWSDTIFVNGTVETGTVDLDITEYLGTWVYKDFDNDDVAIYQGYAEDDPYAGNTDDFLPVAYATAFDGIPVQGSEAGDGDSVTIECHNLFPLDNGNGYYLIGIGFKYNGSIPVHLSAGITAMGGDYQILQALEEADMISYLGVIYDPETGYYGNPFTDLANLQLHEGDEGYVFIGIQIPQNPTDYPALSQENLSGKTATFQAEVKAFQWNEDYSYPSYTPDTY